MYCLKWILPGMEPTPADSRKSSRRRHPKTSRKVDGSGASQASSSSAGSSLASSRVSTPSLATNASSTSANMVTTSSSNTSATSDLRLRFHYGRVSASALAAVFCYCLTLDVVCMKHKITFVCTLPLLGWWVKLKLFI